MKNLVLRLLFVGTGVSLLAAVGHADPMYGVFMVVKGKVQIQKSDGKASDAKVGAKIFEGESVITVVDARAKIVMADRNVLNVSPETTLKIAKYENNAATGSKNVELNLTKGKVRTNVEQTYDGEKSQFQIKTPTAVAGVRGTQFMTGFDVKTQATSIVTFKGSVNLASLAGGSVMVNKGQMTTVLANKAPEAPKSVPKEEMKKMEGESTVSMQNKAEGSGSREPASASNDKSVGGMIDNTDKKPVIDNPPEPPKPPKPPGPASVPTPIPTIPYNPKTKVIITPTLPR